MHRASLSGQSSIKCSIQSIIDSRSAGTPSSTSPNAVLPYHDSAICSSDDGEQNRATVRIHAITDQGIASLPSGMYFRTELSKAELPPKQKAKIDITEAAQTLHSDSIDVYCRPGGRLFRLFKQAVLMSWLASEYAADLFPPDTFFFIQARQFTDSCNDPLAGSSGCSDRLYQRPVSVLFSVNVLAMSPQIHVRNYGLFMGPYQEAFLHYMQFSE